MKSRQGTGPEYYVHRTDSEGLTPTIPVQPANDFPLANSRPLWPKEIGGQWTLTRADGTLEEGWVLTRASEAAGAALQARGFLKTVRPPQDSLLLEAKLVAATIFQCKG